MPVDASLSSPLPVEHTPFALTPHSTYPGCAGPVVLAIMDGVGIGTGDEADAVSQARTPTLSWLKAHALTTSLRAHGTAVGMPSDDDMGNSEVGHNALGAGRIFAQGARLVNEAIHSGAIFQSETWHWLTGPCIHSGHALHLLGLVSDGNVHSHIDHLLALIREADRIGIAQVNIHFLFDGRDVAQISAHLYVARIEAELAQINARGFETAAGGRGLRRYQIVSGGGRMKVTMDRYQAEWSMVERGWRAHVHGIGRPFRSTMEALETFRTESPGITDQNLPEFVIVQDGKPAGKVEDGDAFVFFNFRGDRAIELTQAFELDHFTPFDRGHRPLVRYAGMMQYDGDLRLPTRYLVTPPAIDRTLGEYLATNGITQCALAETQKFGHVTYFWNGNRSGMFDPNFEQYIEIPSDALPFDERPWMKAAEVTDAAVAAITSGRFRHVRLNYANGDMVGHTGVLRSTILAVEAVDLCLARLKHAVELAGGILIVTADHGNADEMYMRDKKGKFEYDKNGVPIPKTSHTLNPVPFYLYDPANTALGKNVLANTAPANAGTYQLNSQVLQPGLANIAATLLNLLGYEAPADYWPSLLTFAR